VLVCEKSDSRTVHKFIVKTRTTSCLYVYDLKRDRWPSGVYVALCVVVDLRGGNRAASEINQLAFRCMKSVVYRRPAVRRCVCDCANITTYLSLSGY